MPFRPRCLSLVALGALLGFAEPARADEPIELVETAPIETTLADADVRTAAEVWLAMVKSATTSIDFAEFYAVDKPGSRLAPIIDALTAAAARGVRIRFLADGAFARKEPDTLARLEKIKGIQVLRLEWATLTGGGVHHAKYFIVDGREAYLGSQNFDWRSLEHIEELGLRVRIPEVIQGLQEIFDADWALGSGAPAPHVAALPHFPVEVKTQAGPLRVTLEASPRGRLPDEGEWGLPKLVGLIDAAQKTVRVQLLTYGTVEHGVYFDELEAALRRAAARGVHVELLVSDWAKRAGMVDGLKSLVLLPNIAVRFLTIPAWSGGFIPFARVAHSKYLVVDGEHAWIGSSNWERMYFYQARNVGLVIDGASFAGRLDQLFANAWTSSYAAPVEPGTTYAPPHVSP